MSNLRFFEISPKIEILRWITSWETVQKISPPQKKTVGKKVGKKKLPTSADVYPWGLFWELSERVGGVFSGNFVFQKPAP